MNFLNPRRDDSKDDIVLDDINRMMEIAWSNHAAVFPDYNSAVTDGSMEALESRMLNFDHPPPHLLP